MNIPNVLTLMRLIIAPIFVAVYLWYPYLGLSMTTVPYILLGLFVVSELSDAFDGFIARRYKQVTNLGKLLDPMADSISRTSAFLAFTQGPVHLPIVIVFIMLYRDSVISTLRTLCALKGETLAARTSGKVKAVVQAVAIFTILVLMIPHAHGYISGGLLYFVSVIAGSIAAGYSVYSGSEYLFNFRRHLTAE